MWPLLAFAARLLRRYTVTDTAAGRVLTFRDQASAAEFAVMCRREGVSAVTRGRSVAVPLNSLWKARRRTERLDGTQVQDGASARSSTAPACQAEDAGSRCSSS